MSATALVHFNHQWIDGRVTWPDVLTWPWDVNYGDMFVCAAILSQTGSSDNDLVQFGDIAPRKVDRAILRGSTYLHNEFNFDNAIKTIDSIDAPIACVGLGAQNPEADVTFLDGNAKAAEFIAKLSEKSASISVRGNFSADVVKRLGARNVRVTGCPSLFYFNRVNPITVSDALRERRPLVGMSTHTELYDDIFCRNAAATFALHGELLSFLVKEAREVRLFEQGLVEERKIADPRVPAAERLEAAAHIARKIGLPDFPPEQLRDMYVDVRAVDEWLAQAAPLDAAIGFRFHGNVLALSQGKPCFYFTYDSRLEEFCRLYNLPFRRIEDGWVDPIQALLDHDWSATTWALTQCHNELAAFYAENGIASNLKPAAVA